jgi:hypothetical protein
MDERLSVAPVVTEFAEAVRDVAGVIAFYAGGSIGSRDYRPGISDLDLVAVLGAPIPRRGRLRRLHARFDVPELHCAYVPQDDIADISVRHLAWAHERLFRRPLSGIARGELHHFGVTVYGPPPADTIPEVSAAQLAQAARDELRGYWLGAVRHRKRWLTDLHVDLGLTTVARADATVSEGRLITKREAIERLAGLGVPGQVIDGIRRRRAGEQVGYTPDELGERARITRRVMRAQLTRMLDLRGGSGHFPMPPDDRRTDA